MMQGDAYNRGIRVLNNAGNPVTLNDVMDVEISIGHITKRYRAAELSYGSSGVWLFPVSQNDSFGYWPDKDIKSNIRLVWNNGVVEGKRIYGVRFDESISKEVLAMANSYGEAAASYTVQVDGPYGYSDSAGKTRDVILYAESWKGGESPFSQAIELDFVSANSIVGIDVSAEDFELLCKNGIGLVSENDGGIVTIHAIGGKPNWNVVIQCTTKEVVRV